MEKPISLQEFADKHRENIDLIKEVVKVITDNYTYSRRTTCAVCDKELTPEEINSLKPEHFHYTCNNHRSFANYYMLDGIRKDIAGLPPADNAYLKMPE